MRLIHHYLPTSASNPFAATHAILPKEPETVDVTLKVGGATKQTLAEQQHTLASPSLDSRPPLSTLSLHKSSQLVGESTPWKETKTILLRPDFVQERKTSCSDEFREHMGIYILIIVLAVIVLVLFILVIVLYSRLINLTVRNLLVTNFTAIGVQSRLDIPTQRSSRAQVGFKT